MRQHFVVDQKLTYADGVAAGETLIVLDSRGAEGRAAARSMGWSTALSALVMTIREDARLLGEVWYRITEMKVLGPSGPSMGVGVRWGLLRLGTGWLIGVWITNSKMYGTAIT